MKCCSRCKNEKPRSEFYRQESSTDGLNAWCKVCHVESVREDRAKRPDYYARKNRENHQKHRDRNIASSRLYYSLNRQKAIAAAMQWQRNNKDRANQILRECGRRLWLNTLHALGDECACCGEKRLTMLNVDHIFNDGGIHRRRVGGVRKTYREILAMENPRSRFQVLCSNCNLSKVRNKGICEHMTNKEPKTLFEAESRFDRFKRRFDFAPFGVA